MTLRVKPIQNAHPKNCCGPRWVRELVAKNAPMTGRVVANPKRTPMARRSQRRAGTASPRRRKRKEMASETRNHVLKVRTAARSMEPPTAYAFMK